MNNTIITLTILLSLYGAGILAAYVWYIAWPNFRVRRTTRQLREWQAERRAWAKERVAVAKAEWTQTTVEHYEPCKHEGGES